MGKNRYIKFFNFKRLTLLFILVLQQAMAQYKIENISFISQNKKIVGKLFLPEKKNRGSFIILGPVAFVKEQSPIQYASRLAKERFLVLIFDPAHYGESEGTPRQMESRKSKIDDIQASVNFLLTRKEVNPEKLYALGICQGANWIIETATIDHRIQGIILVASHLLTPEIAITYCGGIEQVKERLKKAKISQEKFMKTGEIDYIPIVQENSNDTNALLLAKPIAEWYLPWTNHTPYFSFRGNWENKITQMSELDIWGYDITPFMEKIRQPVLMIHSDKAASGAEIPKILFDKISSNKKKLVWLQEHQIQFQFYEESITIDRVVFEITQWQELQ